MNTGEMDSRVTFQRPTVALDEFGDTIKTWATVATVWAKVQHLRGRELVSARQRVAELESTITARHSSILAAVDAKHRISIEGIDYEILWVASEPAGRPTEIQFSVKRRND